jgi:hypothetical protein
MNVCQTHVQPMVSVPTTKVLMFVNVERDSQEMALPVKVRILLIFIIYRSSTRGIRRNSILSNEAYYHFRSILMI